LSAAVVAGVVYDEDVAPAMSVNVFPPSVDTCHWMVGVGSPVAAAVNVAAAPAEAVWFVGWAVTNGTVPTWKFTGSDVCAGVGPPIHTAVSVCAPGVRDVVVRVATPAPGFPALGTLTVPRSVVPSKKSTCPTKGSSSQFEGVGLTVAVRVTGAPTEAGPAGLVVSVVPDTSTCWTTAGAVESAGLQAYDRPEPPPVKLREEIPTGTTEPGVPEMGTVVESPVQLTEVVPLVLLLLGFVGVTDGGVIVTPPGESPMVALLTGARVVGPVAGSMFSVRSRALTGTVDPLGTGLGTVATASTDALSVG
jgi:hypothetical protein